MQLHYNALQVILELLTQTTCYQCELLSLENGNLMVSLYEYINNVLTVVLVYITYIIFYLLSSITVTVFPSVFEAV